jgi:selenide,water dikinase
VLVGIDTSDDAGVYKLTEDLALVQTVDYFTPVVDDPYMFGQIAAANALSDIYAMGGTPMTALNVVGFPIAKLDQQILAEILRGGADKVREAGAVIIGGHSIDDRDPKYGLAVTGVVHPKALWTNTGAKPGDVLVLTKPIGIGILTTAIKRSAVTAEEIERVQEVMTTLNKTAAEVGKEFPVHACTDITGFGLLGHCLEMARGSGVGMEVDASRVPILPRTHELAEQGVVPGGTKKNMAWLEGHVQYAESVDTITRIILCDAVTSGGLLFSIPENEADNFVSRLQEKGVADASIIGIVKEDHPRVIIVK